MIAPPAVLLQPVWNPLDLLRSSTPETPVHSASETRSSRLSLASSKAVDLTFAEAHKRPTLPGDVLPPQPSRLFSPFPGGKPWWLSILARRRVVLSFLLCYHPLVPSPSQQRNPSLSVPRAAPMTAESDPSKSRVALLASLLPTLSYPEPRMMMVASFLISPPEEPGSSRQENVNGRDSCIPEHSNSPESAGPNSPPSVSIESSETAPTDDSLPKKRRSLLDIPSRGSSRVDKQSALDTAQEAAQDDSDNTLRGSKTSILKGRRDQSRGSSRRSRRIDRDVSGVEPKSASTPELDDARPKSGKKSRISIRFLAFLNCCTASSINAEDSLLSPPKKTQPQAVPDRQPAPAADKTSVKPSNSDTAEPKESPYSISEKPNPAISPDQSGTHVEYERCADSKNGTALVDGTSLGANQTVSDHENPPSVEDAGASDPSHSDPAKSKAAAVAMGTFQTEDTDTAPSVADSKSEEIIDKDQAAPEPSISEDTKDGGKDLEAPTSLPFVLPRPPPQTENQEGQQQWLLPPRLPHLQNRKCLVLDLDETLVHSSFKVR